MIILNSEQGTEEWQTEKIGVIGGTRVKSIVTPATLNYPLRQKIWYTG